MDQLTAQQRATLAIILVNFVTVSGFGLMFPVYASFGDQIGASATQLAWAIAGFSTGQLIAAPVTGKLSDRFGRRPVLIVSLLLGSFAYLANSFVTDPTGLIAMRFLSGLCSGGFAVAFAVAADISNRDNRARVMGIVGAGFSAGIILGPALGGLFGMLGSEETAYANVCRLAALMNLGAAAFTAFMLPETRREMPAATGEKPDASSLMRNPAFTIPVLLGFGAMTCVAMMEGTFVVYAERILSMSPMQIGLTFALMGVCSVLVQATLAGRLARWLGEYRLLQCAMVTQIIGLAVLGVFDQVWVVVAGTVAISIGYALLTPSVSALASFAADDKTQGMAQGLVQSASSLGRVIGPASAGPIYDGFGPSAPFSAGAGLLLAVLALAFLWRPRKEAREDMHQGPMLEDAA